MVRAPAVGQGLDLQVDVQVPPQPLLGDATRLQQALLNYAANAVRFTPHGRVLLRVRVEDGRVVIEPLHQAPLSLAQRLAAFDPALHGGEAMPTTQSLGAEQP